jgi:hypothetical protein
MADETRRVRRFSAAIAHVATALSLCAAPVAGQHPFDDARAATAGQVIERLRDASEGIVRVAGPTLRDSAVSAVAGLRTAADHLEAAIGDRGDVTTSDLDGDAERAALRAMVALTIAEDFAAALRTCLREDVANLLASFGENVRRMVGTGLEWSGDAPRVVRATSTTGPFPYTMRAGVPDTLSLAGTGLSTDSCGPATATIVFPDGTLNEVVAMGEGDGTIALQLPSLPEPGTYDIELRLRRRRLLVFCGSERTSLSINVLPPAPFGIRYTVSTTRSMTREIVWNAGELKRANESCGEDVTAATVFSLPEGWTYASHEWIVYLDSGVVREHERVRGNDVFVQYRVPARDGRFCGGAIRMIHGRMEIRGVQTTTEPGPSVKGEFARRLDFGGSLTIPLGLDAGEEWDITEWNIDVRLVHPDGSVHAIPQGGGSRTGGGSFDWDPVTGELTVSAPGGCRTGPSADDPSRALDCLP